jgi:hypothetical protein
MRLTKQISSPSEYDNYYNTPTYNTPMGNYQGEDGKSI